MSTPDPRQEACELFEQFHAEHPDLGPESFEQLCTRHPALAVELRELRDEVLALRDMLELETRSIVAELRRRHGEAIDPGVELSSEATVPIGGERIVLEDLVASHPSGRYRIEREVGRGGGGVVLKIWDEDLRRNLAMKVAIQPRRAGGESLSGSVLSRFLEEAQVTGQLDHPGVVPLHELGLDSHGRAFFTMRLVRGHDLREVFEGMGEGAREDWNRPRALGMLLKVCETMAYAHAKGVIHRDLKPSNVMVGRFGEVYVMDWGLAKVLGRPDRRDLRPRIQESLSSVRTDRRDEHDATPDSPLVTMDGTVVGTPAYMPPEQAAGRVEDLGPRSDVYSVGAMLYHLLTGHAPYWIEGSRLGAYALLAQVLHGPPPPLRSLVGDVPPELEAICERAMARDPQDRYADMGEMAEDLRAYLEGRVVHAYETGALAELRKWTRRNRGFVAWVGAAAVVALLTTSFAFRQTVLANEREESSVRYRDLQVLRELERRAEALWPAEPELVPEYEAWIERALEVEDRVPRYERQLASVRGRALTPDPEQQAFDRANHPLADELELERNNLAWRLQRLADFNESDSDWDWAGEPRTNIEEIREHREGEIERVRNRILELEPLVREPWRFRFANPGDEFLHHVLEEIVERSHELLGEDLEDIRRRLNRAENLATATITGDPVAGLWAEACSAIADPTRSPEYRGLRIEPQAGLIPLGPDPISGLWEFAVYGTGLVPVRGEDGTLSSAELRREEPEVTEDLEEEEPVPQFGIVLVLIPGGSFQMGAQSHYPEKAGHDPDAHADEILPHSVELDPYFIGKTELTQYQWKKLGGGGQSEYEGPVRPVERVSWTSTTEVLRLHGLTLPTEAQWEFAARGGEPESRWCSLDEIAACENLPDATARSWVEDRLSIGWEDVVTWVQEEDGSTETAAVASFRANPFGLHDMLGNVSEWCLDNYARYDRAAEPGTGRRLSEVETHLIVRGGNYQSDLVMARATHRESSAPDVEEVTIGVRVARRLDP